MNVRSREERDKQCSREREEREREERERDGVRVGEQEVERVGLNKREVAREKVNVSDRCSPSITLCPAPSR